MVDDHAVGTMNDDTPAVIVTRGAAPGEYVATRGERIERVFAVVAGETTWVFHDGRVYEIASQNGTGTRRRGPHHHGSLTAPMPATVVTINVQPGDEVKRGDILIVLEAMKMELPVRAPGDGTVEAIHCRAGELVQPGVSLIDLD
jgi:3-methylcrotonyl-CoA carboxylase alpha subunit